MISSSSASQQNDTLQIAWYILPNVKGTTQNNLGTVLEKSGERKNPRRLEK